MTKSETLIEFVVESREHLQSLENSLLALEKTVDLSTIRGLIHEAFRVVHSLKGNAGFFGLTDIRELAHAAESVLEGYRWDPTQLDPRAVQTLLLANDRLRTMVDSVDTPSQFDNRQLLEQLSQFVTSRPANAAAQKQYQLKASKVDSAVALVDFLASQDATFFVQAATPLDLSQPVDTQREISLQLSFDSVLPAVELQEKLSKLCDVNVEDLGWIDISHASSILPYFDDSAGVVPRQLQYDSRSLLEGLPKAPVLLSATPLRSVADQVMPTQEAVKLEEPRREQPRQIEMPTPVTPTAAASIQTERSEPVAPSQTVLNTPSGASTPGASSPTNLGSEKPTSIRIPVELLDRLMNLVGELTIVRNQSQATLGEGEDAARAVSQRLDSVTSELQDTVLKTRMQPVGNLFGRFPRMVRDLARQLGKQVEINFLGQEVELDKSVLEQLSDPLTHLIRNSIDHGIELPEVRVAKGKPAVGRVVVAATAGDGQVHIEIRDDGRGLDPVAIRAKTLSLGLKTEAELQKLTPKELASFILLPGFSTAAKVTDVSGRGVGMDVVKTNIERLEGSLTIDSEFGVGTTILLRVPLTLAIIPCLIVHVGNERLAIPQRAIEEIVCIYPGGNTEIESTHNAEYLRLRDSLVPVARMNEVMARPNPFNEATRTEIVAKYVHQRLQSEPAIQYVLVLNTGGQRFGLLVDDVKGTEEVVVKPMHPSLKKVSIFSGATVMGDGKVALIASAEGIATHADCSLPKQVKEKDAAASLRDPAEVHRVLLFEYGPDEVFALPLIQIRRVEAMKRESLEHVGNHQFVSIGGVSTRLVFLDKILNVSGCELGQEFHVIMPKFVVEPMGIVASRIVDTESMSIELQEASVSDPGILGTALIRGRLSVFLDTQYLREKTFTSHLGETVQKRNHITDEEGDVANEPEGEAKPTAHVLLVDDTPFFREIVRRYLESLGMTTVTAVDGIDGLRKSAAEDFDLIVSDIEMPNMNGWEFGEAVRKQGYDGPMIALTSLSKLENERRAKDCGFDAYEEKLDHDRLIQTVRRTLNSRASSRRVASQGGAR